MAGLGETAAQPAIPAPEFTSPEESPYVAAEGKAQLIWKLGDEEEETTAFELQQAKTEDFSDAHTRYQGRDRSTYVSGLPSGDFYYRVRVANDGEEPGPWSETMHVRVEYVSMKLVVTLVAIGLIVFVATVATVLTGHRRAARAKAIEP